MNKEGCNLLGIQKISDPNSVVRFETSRGAKDIPLSSIIDVIYHNNGEIVELLNSDPSKDFQICLRDVQRVTTYSSPSALCTRVEPTIGQN